MAEQFPQVPPIMRAPANPAAPGGKPPSRAATGLAALFAISITAAVGTFTDIGSHENAGKPKLCAYRDSVGIWTLDRGIIRHPDGRPVHEGDCITQEQADDYYETEVVNHARPLAACLGDELRGHGNQVRALIDLSYNVGPVPICKGTIGKDIRAGDWIGAQVAIGGFNRGTFARPFAGGQCRPHPSKAGKWTCVIRGLDNRRKQNEARFAIDRPSQGTR